MKLIRSLQRGQIPSWFAISFGCVLIGVAFTLCLQRTLAIETTVPVSVFNAIPPALSSMVFEHKKKYTSLIAVSDMFRSDLGDYASHARAINSAIGRIASSDLTKSNRD